MAVTSFQARWQQNFLTISAAHVTRHKKSIHHFFLTVLPYVTRAPATSVKFYIEVSYNSKYASLIPYFESSSVAISLENPVTLCQFKAYVERIMENVIINKVAESALTSLDLEEYYPKEAIAVFDMKDHLFMGLILKEKDFRAALSTLDWEQYRDKNVALTCSADAIIPVWAYMLAATNLQPVAKAVVFGDEKTLVNTLIIKNISAINGEDYTDKRVVVKGCGDTPIPEAAYVEITSKLRPYVKSIMYGEPCSTVPIYKRK